MTKLRLIGLGSERSAILDALAATGLAEIKDCKVSADLSCPSAAEEKAEIQAKADRVEECIALITKEAEARIREDKHIDGTFLKDGFDVDYTSFMQAPFKEKALLPLCAEVESAAARIADANGEITRLNVRKRALLPFLAVQAPLDSFKDTRHAVIALGTLPADRAEAFAALSQDAAAECRVYPSEGDRVAALVAAHAEIAEEILSSAAALGFQRCPFYENKTAEELTADVDGEIAEAEKKIAELKNAVYAASGKLKDLKILGDYLAFELEKLGCKEKFPHTAAAFVMEAYVPKEGQNAVLCAIKGVSENIYTEFVPVDKDDDPPTLMKNNRVVKNYEFITNMYTPPSYGEFDPNAIMSVFFSIFLGFIMADIGYGILMMLIGVIFALRTKRDTGMKRLMKVIGYSGIFTVIFGALFGSFFGFSATANDINGFAVSFLPKAILPDAKDSAWKLAGITIPSVLLIALGMGVVQLMAGNLCKAYAEFRQGHVADGIFFGVIWAIFLGGMLVLAVGLIEDFGMGYLVLPGGIIAGASLLVGAATAGIRERGFGKVKKSFGAVYGIINYMSDILSYARLYGLMLSGAIIAQIASGQGLLLVTGGNPVLAVLGVAVMIIGHAFNLAMGLLGAYIHDSRLQYIEFFGRFYTGEGELFAPLGGKHKYVYITPQKAQGKAR